MKYLAERKSIDSHKVPIWYDEAKYGIFVHWSLFSVPSFAHIANKSLQNLAEEGDGIEASMKYSPYAEWYWNSLRIDGSPTRKYHEEKYGKDFKYQDFQKMFEEKSKNVDFDAWAKLFKECGAKYVVLVTKHHDGYCLWPSDYKNPFDENYQCSDDYVGRLTKAVRAQGIKMGLYYSGIYDWTFKDYPIKDMSSWIKHNQASDQYAEYSKNQTYELIAKYKPDILWNDIGYPSQIDLNKLMADYYNAVPEGLVNDRWKQTPSYEEGTPEFNKLKDDLEKALVEGGISGILDSDIHRDYFSPEYQEIDSIQEEKWEETRGVGMSFGFNAQEGEETTLSPKAGVTKLVDIVSKNGNLLLNVGPKADGSIPQIQKKTLVGIGDFLKVNGEGVYATKPWKKCSAETVDGQSVRFTSKKNVLYIFVLTDNLNNKVEIKNLQLDKCKKITLLGNDASVKFQQNEKNLVINISGEITSQLAYCFKVEQ